MERKREDDYYEVNGLRKETVGRKIAKGVGKGNLKRGEPPAGYR
jgi:hypothetical protein